MKVITLAKTKELLGIGDTSLDASITAKIPYIDAKVKRITKNKYNMQIVGDVTLNSNLVTVRGIVSPDSDGINNNYHYDSIYEYLEIGQLVEGTGIPAETYIEDIYQDVESYGNNVFQSSVVTIKLSAVATATTTGAKIYVGINIAYQDIIAKGIQFLISGTSTTLPTNSLASRSLGPSSKTYSTADQKMDNKYGMPAWFVKALPRYMSGH